MSKIFNVDVANKIATHQQSDGVIICGNSDYKIKFNFDEEWNGQSKKTARFVWLNQYHDVEFTGDTVNVPVILATDKVSVGVYVGEVPDGGTVLSTTHVDIMCVPSIRSAQPSANPLTGINYTNEARGYANDAKASATEAKEYADGLENAIAMKKGHSYTLDCGDISSWSAEYYPREINKRFIAGGKLYSKMWVQEPDYDMVYTPALMYDDETAYSGELSYWFLSKSVTFIDSLTNDEAVLIELLRMYMGTDDGEVDVFVCGDKLLGIAAGESGVSWTTVTTHPYFQADIATPLYEIRIFDAITTNPGVYSIRLRHQNDILANFIMVCNGDIAVGKSIYSTPCYCTELNKMVMLEMKHHNYTGFEGDREYYEDHTLIHVKDMNGNDVTDALIGLHEYDWCHDNHNGSWGGLEYTKLA